MTEFGAAATLHIEEIEGAAAAVERDVTVPMDVSSQPSRRPPAGPMADGGVAGGGGGPSLSSLAEERNETLVEILDVLEETGTTGAAGGGGGGGLGLGTRALGGAGGGLAAGALALAGAGIGGSRFALGQGMFGEAGRETMQRRKQFEGMSGIEFAMDNPGKALANGFTTAYDPSGLGETMARSFGSTAASELRDAAPDEFVTELDQSFSTLESAMSDPPNPFEGVSWPELPDLSSEVSWPDLPSPSEDFWPSIPDPGKDFWPDVPNPFDQNKQQNPPSDLSELSRENRRQLAGADPAQPSDSGFGGIDISFEIRELRGLQDDIDKAQNQLEQFKREITDG